MVLAGLLVLPGLEGLRRISLERNNMGHEGAAALCPAIASSCSLTECNLKGNSLGMEQWIALFNALRKNPKNRISKWDLHGQGLDTVVAKAIADYMTTSTCLATLLIGRNSLESDGAIALAHSID